MVLTEIARSVPPEGVTLNELLVWLGERGLLLLSVILTVPFLFPFAIPGTSFPFGLIIALIGVGIARNRLPYLPQRLMNRRLTADTLVPVLARAARLCTRIERLIHPRLFLLTHRATIGRVNALLLVLSAIMLMAPVPVPFSDMLPAYSILFLAAGTLERDGCVVLAGYMTVLLSLSYFSVMALIGTAGLRTFFTG